MLNSRANGESAPAFRSHHSPWLRTSRAKAGSSRCSQLQPTRKASTDPGARGSAAAGSPGGAPGDRNQ
jgi:hypothetical protein